MSILDWLNLLIRWAHFIAGIAWIGSSFYFIWLDSHLEKPAREKADVEGELWMVHSGGFYQVEKRIIGPGRMPAVLHWFMWEATLTWITGLFLLGVVYYSTKGVYLVDAQVAQIPVWVAIVIGIASIIVSWVAYDRIWSSPLRHRPAFATALCLVLLAGLVWALTDWLSGRAAYIHVGAALGSIMAANVLERILPAQRRMIRATERGEAPDLTEGLNAKTRSVHNTYLTFPVLFLMLSNHFPAVYAHPWSPWLLLLLAVLGAGARHVMVGKGAGRWWALAAAAAALIALVAITARGSATWVRPAAAATAPAAAPAYRAVKGVIVSRCQMCHSAQPPDDSFGPMPGGVAFDTDAQIRDYATRIYVRAVLTRTMPIANRTKITDGERMLLARWYENGAAVP